MVDICLYIVRKGDPLIRILLVTTDAIKLSLVAQCALVAAFACFLVLPVYAVAQGSITVTYDVDSGNFTNPERGWHEQINPYYTSDVTANPITTTQLDKYRDDNLTLVSKYYLIKDFVDSPISQSYLDNQVINDLNVCRQSGFKLIPRFTYNFNQNISNKNASIDRVLQHIEQLRPIFQQHWDVIAFVESGFIGKWGEWHGSSNDLTDFRALNNTSHDIIDKLLDVIPSQRHILLRLPQYKIDNNYYPNPLKPSNAFSCTEQARIGYNNDGWLHDDTDWGTWEAGRQKAQETYVAADALYVPMSGEPANGSAYAQARDALSDVEKFHWSSMSRNHWDARDIYDHWKSEREYDDIERLMGYRFVLLNATLPLSVRQGGDLTLTLQIRNDGATRPYNPRMFEVILRHHASGTIYRVAYDESDVRLWLPGPGETKTLTFHKALPQAIKLGAYDVLLNLADPAPNLYSDPRYSIRLANVGLWEQDTGFNSLNASVSVVLLTPATNIRVKGY